MIAVLSIFCGIVNVIFSFSWFKVTGIPILGTQFREHFPLMLNDWLSLYADLHGIHYSYLDMSCQGTEGTFIDCYRWAYELEINRDFSCHSDITWASWHLKSLSTPLFVQKIIQANKRTVYGRCFVRGIHQSMMDSPHKWPVKQKTFPCQGVIIYRYDCRYIKFYIESIIPI